MACIEKIPFPLRLFINFVFFFYETNEALNGATTGAAFYKSLRYLLKISYKYMSKYINCDVVFLWLLPDPDLKLVHCMENSGIQIFTWLVFCCIWTKYGNMRSQSANFRIQMTFVNTRTRKNPVFFKYQQLSLGDYEGFKS